MFLVGIIILLTLIFTTENNPFNLSYWLVICNSGFALSFANYILYERSKFGKLLLIISIIDFILIHFALTVPSFYDLIWNFALAATISILGTGVYALIPTSKNLLTISAKISILLSFLLLVIICLGKLEESIVYSIGFYTLAMSSLLLLVSIIASKQQVKVD